ncbi:Apoptotic chromatin condensation inducer in the nucleus [Heracleum sosnowskyi]|uniref:Apoptotic chromatin condensation inducer in the nucleus n=1 Tax=Heracleum sosnowskyi TaxID=360622 RepID=A0AAD8NDF9_9APIA|nr:Apoptotic chromatin condensation inducer in the nucleus [Heracleum sosnowskyi]
MSSYPVLYNKPIDQWKVTELKDELRKRKLPIKGLKDDLIRRLDESLQQEIGSTNRSDEGFASQPEPDVQYQDATGMPGFDEKNSVTIDKSEDQDTDPNVEVNMRSILQEQVEEGDTKALKPVMVAETTVESDVQEITLDPSVQEITLEPSDYQANTMEASNEVTTVETVTEVTTVETSHEVTTVEFSPVVGVAELKSSGQELLNNGSQNVCEDTEIQPQNQNPPNEDAKFNSSDLETQPQNEDSNPPHEANINSFAPESQVFEHDREEPSSGNVDLDDGNLQPMDVKQPEECEVKVEETANNADNPDIAKNNDSGDVEFSEKLNLDRSSGDDSIEEDPLESKQVESKSTSDEADDKREKMEVTIVRGDLPVDVMVVDTIPDGKVENKNVTAVASMKRKPHADQETVGNVDTTKRQRRWNSEGLKALEPNSDNVSPSITPRGTFQSNAKRNFSKSVSMSSVESPKERTVPPSLKPPTSALRIDRFVRPFTLKAVQELLGKTGKVTNFWMDHIKTHCYVSYSSIEEAVETRNAVYNLQWPANGGRLLVAEFVEPQEVQMRIEAPPAAPVNTGPVQPAVPVPMQSQPSPRVQVQRQAPQAPVSLPPPPPAPVSNPPTPRERALPPPPPLPERVEPPIVTLDDLFRKTKATPRIYYLPLSDEQVKAKQSAERKPPSSLQVFACRKKLCRSWLSWIFVSFERAPFC